MNSRSPARAAAGGEAGIGGARIEPYAAVPRLA
jgi:hypothetical protein